MAPREEEAMERRRHGVRIGVPHAGRGSRGAVEEGGSVGPARGGDGEGDRLVKENERRLGHCERDNESDI